MTLFISHGVRREHAFAHCQHRLLYFGTEGQNLPEDLSSFGCGLSHSIEAKDTLRTSSASYGPKGHPRLRRVALMRHQ